MNDQQKRLLELDFADVLRDENIHLQDLAHSTIFVTGATGYIGSLLIRTLLFLEEREDLGLSVIGLARNPEKVEAIYGRQFPSNLRIMYADIADPFQNDIEDGEKIDYIFHTASVTASKYMISNPVETIMTSIDGTRQILEMARRHPVKSMVYLSSMEMYGNFAATDEARWNCTEDQLGYIDLMDVRSDYPESKRMCENMCVAYHRQYGIPVKIARLAQTFGAGVLPWDHRIFVQLSKGVIAGENFVMHTEGKSESNYCYSMDSVRGLLTVLLKGKAPEPYNIANEAAHTTIRDMANMVCREFGGGRSRVVIDIPKGNVFGYAPDKVLKLSSVKLRGLGWEPYYDLKEIYQRTIAYMREEEDSYRKLYG